MSFLIPSPPTDATETRRGLVSTVAQTFSGLKRFLHGLRTSKVVFDDETEMTTAPVDASLESVGTGQSVVADGAGPAMTLKRIRGTGVASVTATADTLDVNVPVPPVTSLSDSGAGLSLVKVGTGPSLGLKKLVQGSGVVLTPTAEGVEVAAAATTPVSLGSAGSGVSIVEAGTGPNLLVASFMSSTAHRFALSKSANRLVIGMEDTGFLECVYFGPYTYQRRTRIRPLGTGAWGAWSGWEDAGTKNHAWVERAPGKVVARRAGVFGYIMGIVQRNTDTDLPTPSNSDTYEEEFQWKSGHTPASDRAIVGLPIAASPGVNWYTGTQNSWYPSAQQQAHPSGLILASNVVYYESSGGPAAHSNGTWLRVCHHWMVT